MRIAALHCSGSRAPVLFLHGFGSTKEDYADAPAFAAFDDRGIIAFDAPGFGETECAPVAVTANMIAAVADIVLQRLDAGPVHLVGHSMGGLAGLLFAADSPHRILSFTSIEGNLAPEDCFISRLAYELDTRCGADFLKALRQRLDDREALSLPGYAAGLAHKVRSWSAVPILRSIVEHSDNGDLLDRFLSMRQPRMFMYGSENRSLSYIGRLGGEGVRLAEIADCGHFPMYANPPRMWRELGAFIEAVDAGALP
jgi:pimeloyl-ACP methyl ester carboxylesterase